MRAKYELAKDLETNVRGKETGQIKVRIIGFAKLIGELIEGLAKVMAYFAVAALIAAVILYLYTRCIRSTLLVIACSLIAVVWQLGLVSDAWASSSTRSRSSCRSSCSRSGCRTARRR